jgi:DNA-binding transcriptional LysR family regulator
MLDLRRVMLLCDLAELGTVTAVAERRSITSSAVSQQLRVLEDEVGVTLFRRNGRHLGLTRGGDVLVEHVRHVLSALDEAESAVAGMREGIAGQIRIAAFNMAIPLLAAPLVARLGAGERGLQFEVQQLPVQAALRELRRGDVDLAITVRYPFNERQSRNGLVAEKLLDEPFVLLSPREQHLRIRNSGLAVLADKPWVAGLPDTGLGLVLQHLADARGFAPKVKHRVNGARNICELAATEMASAIAPRLAVPVELEGLIVDGLDLGSRQLDVVVREGRQRDPNIKVVLRELREIVGEKWSEISPAPRGVAV